MSSPWLCRTHSLAHGFPETLGERHGHDPEVRADVQEEVVADGERGEVDAARDALVILLQHDQQRQDVSHHPHAHHYWQVVLVHLHADLRCQVPEKKRVETRAQYLVHLTLTLHALREFLIA